MTKFVVSHVQGECLSLTVYKKIKEISHFKCMEAFLDTLLYTVLMFFYCIVALVLMPKECENVSQRMGTAAL